MRGNIGMRVRGNRDACAGKQYKLGKHASLQHRSCYYGKLPPAAGAIETAYLILYINHILIILYAIYYNIDITSILK